MTFEHIMAVLLAILGTLVLAWQGWLTWTMLQHEKLLTKLTTQIAMIIDHCTQRQVVTNKADEEHTRTINALFSAIRRTERNIIKVAIKMDIDDLETPSE